MNMISKADELSGSNKPRNQKPLSFSISRILHGADDNTPPTDVRSDSPAADTESSARVAAGALHEPEYYPRVPSLHAATEHHNAPYAETDGYSHFGMFRIKKDDNYKYLFGLCLKL